MQINDPAHMIDDEIEALEKGKLTTGASSRPERIELLQRRLNVLNVLRSRLPPREERTKALRKLDKRVLATILELVDAIKEERATATRLREKRHRKKEKKFAHKLTPEQQRELAKVEKKVAEIKRKDAQYKQSMQLKQEEQAKESSQGWVKIYQGGAPGLGKRS